MSEVRDNTVRDAPSGGAVDQSARATQVVIDDDEDNDQEDAVAALQRQLKEREELDRQREKELADERAARAREASRASAAEARARDADAAREREVAASKRDIEAERLAAITSSLGSHEAKMASLKRDYAQAFSDGAGDKMAEIQAEMAVTGASIVQLQQGKAAIEERRKEEPAGREATTEQPRNADREREDFIRQQPPRVQEWLRGADGARYFTDENFRQRVAAAANFATQARGIAPDSQEFIDFVEESVGLRKPPERELDTRREGEDGRDGRKADDRRMIAAPAGGSAPGNERAAARQQQVHLTKAEREIARSMDLTDAEYAKHKLDLLNEGLIGPGVR